MTLWTNGQEREDVEALRGCCHRVIAHSLPTWRSLWNCLRELPGKEPLQAVYCHSSALGAAMERATGEDGGHYDVLHVEHLRGALYGNGIDLPKVWDAVDCITYLFEQAAQHSRSAFGRLASRLELPRTRLCEARLLRHYDHVLTTSDRDRAALMQLSNGGAPGQSAPVTVIPNGVDLTYFRPIALSREPATLIITGKMSYHANVTGVLHFCDEVLPLIKSRRSDVKLWIVGKGPSAALARLATDPSITVTGYVPDLRPYLARATLAVSPVLYGAGCQNKVLEAMAIGTPVVSTSVSTWGISAKPGLDLLVADTPQTMAESVLELLSDSSKRERLAGQARKTVETHHDWNAVVQRLEGVYSNLRDLRPASRVSSEGEQGNGK
jgi:glycosyltransferase involved in cell wall biosynthesis